MATTANPRIAIIGGGPGGLVLALTLHRRGIPATVYEREVSPDSRRHLGGMLDLGYDSGQRALRENGLEELDDGGIEELDDVGIGELDDGGIEELDDGGIDEFGRLAGGLSDGRCHCW